MEHNIKVWWACSAFILNTVIMTSIMTLDATIIPSYITYIVSATWPILLTQICMLLMNADGLYYGIAVLNTIIQIYLWIATTIYLYGVTVIYLAPIMIWCVQIFGMILLGARKYINDTAGKSVKFEAKSLSRLVNSWDGTSGTTKI